MMEFFDSVSGILVVYGPFRVKDLCWLVGDLLMFMLQSVNSQIGYLVVEDFFSPQSFYVFVSEVYELLSYWLILFNGWLFRLSMLSSIFLLLSFKKPCAFIGDFCDKGWCEDLLFYSTIFCSLQCSIMSLERSENLMMFFQLL